MLKQGNANGLCFMLCLDIVNKPKFGVGCKHVVSLGA